MTPEALRLSLLKAGLHIVEEPGWRKRGNLWNINAKPEGVMHHHTAPPNPYPIGKLYGPPFYRIKCNMATHENGTLYLVAYKSCNYSSGYGMRSVLTDNVRPSIAPTHNARQRGLKSGNRHFWNYENSHPGDGSPIPQVQLDTIIESTQIVLDQFELDPDQVISHAEWTSRMIDPRWNGSNRTAIEQIREAVEVITRQSKADDGLDTLAANFQELRDAGVFTKHTQAGGVTFNDEFATFLLKFEDYIVHKYELGHTHIGFDGLTNDDVLALIDRSTVRAPR